MNSPTFITIGDSITLDDGDFDIVGFGNGVFRLRHRMTDEYRLIEHLELANHLPPAAVIDVKQKDGAAQKKDGPPPTLYAALEELDDEAKTLIPHLQELLDGTAPHDEPNRPEYALKASRQAAKEAKARQRAAEPSAALGAHHHASEGNEDSDTFIDFGDR